MADRAVAKPAVYVAESDIHGRGVFAARHIRKGATIGTFEGVPTRRNGRYVLWVERDDGGWDGRRGTGDLRFVNHSDTPNAEFRGWDLVALRAIRSGEEVTVDYGEAE